MAGLKVNRQEISNKSIRLTKVGKISLGVLVIVLVIFSVSLVISSGKKKNVLSEEIELESAIQRAVLLCTTEFKTEDWGSYTSIIEGSSDVSEKYNTTLSMLGKASSLEASVSVTDDINGARNRLMLSYNRWKGAKIK